jgi:DNA-binding SARP family transcriptional activator
MWFGVLGPLQVVAGDPGQPDVVSAARLRALLAVLLWRSNEPVAIDELAELVWDGAPPGGAPEATRALVMRLRRRLDRRAAARIVTRAPGYAIEAADDELDASLFETLTRQAGAAAGSGQWARAARTGAEALQLWRGTPLTDIPSQTLRDQWVPTLDRLHMQALGWRAEGYLREGHHEQLIPDLRDLTARYPLQERFHGQLMLALARSGRQAEALAAYQHLSSVLVSELGAEPGTELRALHQQILRAGHAPADSPPAASLAGPGPEGTTRRRIVGGLVPRQLPAVVAGFTGRAGEQAALLRILDQASRGTPGSVVVSAIGGPPGVGKTALAIHCAHQVAARFEDGQLYVNLRGFDPVGPPAAPAEAIRGFLDALGVPPEQIPPGLDAQAGLYRSLLSGKRMLIVLDNARDERQVRPLLPGSPGCPVIITSRRTLAGLAVSNGARPITLDVLTTTEARQLLAARLGAERVAAEPGAVTELAGQCGCLPLALAVAAAHAAFRPEIPVAALVAELSDTASRLDALDTGDPAASVRTVFSWSYTELTAAAARMFRLLGLHPGPDITAMAAGSLAACSSAAARRMLAELTDAHLLTECRHGRYTCHDLLRTYAASQTRSTDSDLDREAATGRLLDYYLHAAHAAACILSPSRQPISLPPPSLGSRLSCPPTIRRQWPGSTTSSTFSSPPPCSPPRRGQRTPGRSRQR